MTKVAKRKTKKKVRKKAAKKKAAKGKTNKKATKRKANKKDDSDPFEFIGLPKTKSLKGLGLGNDNKKRKKDDKWFTELIQL